jgi:hypothetical protein
MKKLPRIVRVTSPRYAGGEFVTENYALLLAGSKSGVKDEKSF